MLLHRQQQKIDVPLFQEVFCFVWLFRIDESPNICNDQSQAAIPFNFESHTAVCPLANSRRQVARTWWGMRWLLLPYNTDACVVFEVSRHMRPISNTCHPYLWAETIFFRENRRCALHAFWREGITQKKPDGKCKIISLIGPFKPVMWKQTLVFSYSNLMYLKFPVLTKKQVLGLIKTLSTYFYYRDMKNCFWNDCNWLFPRDCEETGETKSMTAKKHQVKHAFGWFFVFCNTSCNYFSQQYLTAYSHAIPNFPPQYT